MGKPTGFKEFPRKRLIPLSSFVTMAEYDKNFGLPAAFPDSRQAKDWKGLPPMAEPP